MLIFVPIFDHNNLMKRLFDTYKTLALLLLSGSLLTGCRGVFDVHPYDMDIHGEHGINANHIAQIEQQCEGKDTLHVAFISDTHGWYKQLMDEVADINSRPEIDFVVHCGDLTDTGTTKEFRRIRWEMDKLRVPYVALIGNHDFLGTGDQMYEWMFGSKNFSFIVSRVKFVCLDTNAMEYDRVAPVPDFSFMQREMTADSTAFDRTIIVMHAAPYSDEFNDNVSLVFNYYTMRFPGLMCCIFGHDHTGETRRIYDDGPLYHGIDCAEHRNYKLFTITPDGYEVERIDY